MATASNDTISADAGTVAKSKEIEYRCGICGETRSNLGSLKRHISAKEDADHAGKSPSTDPHLVEYVGETEEVLARLNERTDAKGVVSDNHFKLLWAIYNDPDASREDLSRQLSVSTSTIDNYLGDLSLISEGNPGGSVQDRKERAAALLSDAGVEFVGPDEEPDDGGADDEYDPFPDPDDMTVNSLSVGDTKDNTEVGGWYEARVNNVEPYGVFVTLARSASGDYKDDYTGLVHKRNIPALYVPNDYSQGDLVVVERLPDDEDVGNGENGRTPLRMCTDPSGDWIVQAPVTPVAGASDDAEDSEGDTASGDSNASTGRVRTQKGNASYDGPETGVDLTEQYVSERPHQDDPIEPDELEAKNAERPPASDEDDGPSAREKASALATAMANIQDRLSDVADEGDVDRLGNSLDSMHNHLEAIEAAVSKRDSAPGDAEYTLHLTREEMKQLVREAPDDVADKALDALAGGP
jgi:hypothetical protein